MESPVAKFLHLNLLVQTQLCHYPYHPTLIKKKRFWSRLECLCENTYSEGPFFLNSHVCLKVIILSSRQLQGLARWKWYNKNGLFLESKMALEVIFNAVFEYENSLFVAFYFIAIVFASLKICTICFKITR